MDCREVLKRQTEPSPLLVRTGQVCNKPNPKCRRHWDPQAVFSELLGPISKPSPARSLPPPKGTPDCWRHDLEHDLPEGPVHTRVSLREGSPVPHGDYPAWHMRRHLRDSF